MLNRVKATNQPSCGKDADRRKKSSKQPIVRGAINLFADAVEHQSLTRHGGGGRGEEAPERWEKGLPEAR